MQCRLCLQDRVLRDSHIIPEFLYRAGYDDKHRMQVIKPYLPKPKYIQKGLRERLLCDECEGRLANRFEDYFARTWYAPGFLPTSTSKRRLSIHGLNYQLFKLFLLSVIWRASISTQPAFSEVSLGVEENRIRQMLLNEDPGQPNEYQIVATLLLLPKSNEVLGGLITSPVRNEFLGLPTYMLVFGGCVWVYVASQEPIAAFSQATISRDGNMLIAVRNLNEIKQLDGFFAEYVSSQKSGDV